MKRRRKQNTETVSLFPMFNILIGVLGCLIFIVGSVLALSMGAEKNIIVDNQFEGGVTQKKEPVYIEWDGKSITVHPGRQITLINLEEAKLSKKDLQEIVSTSGSVEEMMEKARVFRAKRMRSQFKDTFFEETFNDVFENRENKYFIVLVRPAGFKSMIKFRNFLMAQGIDVGYEPVGEYWKIRIR